MESVVKALLYVHNNKEPERQWDIAVNGLRSLGQYERVQVWIKLSNYVMKDDIIQTLALKTQYKFLFNLALREAEVHNFVSGVSADEVENVLRTSIELCRDFNTVFDMTDTRRKINKLRNAHALDDDDVSSRGSDSGDSVPHSEHAPSRQPAAVQPQYTTQVESIVALHRKLALLETSINTTGTKLDTLLARLPASPVIASDIIDRLTVPLAGVATGLEHHTTSIGMLTREQEGNTAKLAGLERCMNELAQKLTSLEESQKTELAALRRHLDENCCGKLEQKLDAMQAELGGRIQQLLDEAEPRNAAPPVSNENSDASAGSPGRRNRPTRRRPSQEGESRPQFVPSGNASSGNVSPVRQVPTRELRSEPAQVPTRQLNSLWSLTWPTSSASAQSPPASP